MNVKKAVLIGKNILIALWEDNYLTICTNKECYTTSRASKDNEKLFYIAQAFYSDKKIKKLI